MYISIDLGGTKMLSALLDSDLNVVETVKIRTPQTTDGDELLQCMVDSIAELCKAADIPQSTILGIGIGVPSAVDFEAGIVLSPPNIGIDNYPLKAKLEKLTGIPVLVENDVNAGLYGEYRKGAGKGKKHIVGLYPGTGIGGAMVLDGHLYRGARGGAGELGHMIVQSEGRLCGCGRYGCLETVASKTALAKDLVQLGVIGKAPSIYEKVGSDYTRIKSNHIKKAMEAGEEAVIDLVNRAADFLGIGMASSVNIFNPELIILGGGLVEKLGKRFVDRAVTSMKNHAMPVLLQDVEVRTAALGDNTVIIGAGLLIADKAN